jgi:hypothetical protein
VLSVWGTRGARATQFESEAAEDRGLEVFLNRFLADSRVDLPEATVIDVGRIEGLGWGRVERNAAWGVGIYGCDPAKVFEVVRRAALRSAG